MNRFLTLLIMLLMPLSALSQSTALLDGSGLANGKSYTNYIKNPNAQKNVSNVTATGDTVITRSVTTPLYNSSEFNITDTDAWGATWSTLALNEGLKNRLCEVQLLARSTAADVATLKVFQNSVAVFSQSLTLSTTNPTKYGGTFPCGDLTYASTVELAGAADPGTIEVGAVYLGEPVSVSSGGIMTEWQSYTPTVSHASGGATNLTTTGKWKRVGDELVGSINVSASAASATFTGFRASIPAGLTIDASKFPVSSYTRSLGTGTMIPGDNTYESPVVPYYASTTTIGAFYVTTISGTNPQPLNTNNITDAQASSNVFKLNFSYRVPIVGWAATDIVTPEQSIAGVVQARRITSVQTVASGATDVIIFNGELGDVKGEYDTSTGKFQPKQSGWYSFSYGLQIIPGATPPTSVGVFGRINSAGNLYAANTVQDLAASKIRSITGSFVAYLTPSDYLWMYAQPVGQAIDIGFGGSDTSWFHVAPTSGPGSQSFYLSSPLVAPPDGTGIKLKSSTNTDVLTVSDAGAAVIGPTTGVAVSNVGILNVNNTTDATSTTDGSLQTDGGLSVAKNAYVGGALRIPTQVTLSDNVSVAGKSWAFYNTNSPLTINGLSGGVTGQLIVLMNDGVNTVTLTYNNAGGTQKFMTPNNASVVMGQHTQRLAFFGGTFWHILGPID